MCSGGLLGGVKNKLRKRLAWRSGSGFWRGIASPLLFTPSTMHHTTIMGVNHLFLLFLSLLSIAIASDAHVPAKDTRRGIRWLEADRSLLIHLHTPDLPLADNPLQTSPYLPSYLILNFTLQNKKTLLLNGVPITPLQDANIPASLFAHQTNISLTDFEHEDLPSFEDEALYALDYYRTVTPNEDPGEAYNIYNPRLELDIIGAEGAGYQTYLHKGEHRKIHISLEELPPHQKYPYNKPISKLEFRIGDVVLMDRQPMGYSVTIPPPACTLWSWRCAEVDEYPWYRTVFRESFDEYGRIGSFRHMLYKHIYERFSWWQVTMMAFVTFGTVLVLLAYATRWVYRYVRISQRRIMLLQRRRIEAEHWRINDDQESESLLYFDDEGDDHTVQSRRGYATEQPERSGAGVGKPLPGKPLPPIPSASTQDLI